MATRLSPLGKALKWLVVPALCAAIGYYLIGPRVKDKLPASVKEEVKSLTGGTLTNNGPKTEEPTGLNTTTQHRFSEPEVDVTVSKLGSPDQPKKKKRRKKKKPPTETPSAPVELPSGGGGTEPPPPDGARNG